MAQRVEIADQPQRAVERQRAEDPGARSSSGHVQRPPDNASSFAMWFSTASVRAQILGGVPDLRASLVRSATAGDTMWCEWALDVARQAAAAVRICSVSSSSSCSHALAAGG